MIPRQDLGLTIFQNVKWPLDLHTLNFESNLPIQGIIWPLHLHTLKFGYFFCQSIKGVTWPAFLHTLEFENASMQHFIKVKWPSSLCILKVADILQDLSKDINQPIERNSKRSRDSSTENGQCKQVKSV